jgi:hypothetical protein
MSSCSSVCHGRDDLLLVQFAPVGMSFRSSDLRSNHPIAAEFLSDEQELIPTASAELFAISHRLFSYSLAWLGI